MSLHGVALVTGASRGIGEAVARAVAGLGMDLCLSGRDPARLQAVAEACRGHGVRVVDHPADLTLDDDLRALAGRVESAFARLDVLVHAAGAIRVGDIEAAAWDDLDALYRLDLRAPFLLTKALLSMLKRGRGQVVFLNSTAGLTARADNGPYAAMKHALSALAQSVRAHVNPFGVRVLSVFPGRTLTGMQLEAQRLEGRSYPPEELLKPADVAVVITSALSMPRSVEVTDVVVRPMPGAGAPPMSR